MGMGPRPTRTTPDGRNMTQPFYDQYMANVYNPQQDFNASANAPIPGVLGGQPSSTPPSGLHPPQDASRGLLAGVGANWMNQNMSSSDWTSLLPSGYGGPQTAQNPLAQNHMQPVSGGQGPYAQQAMMLAGLLGPQSSQQGGGLLGAKRVTRFPGGK
jgi:hypothetical protein